MGKFEAGHTFDLLLLLVDFFLSLRHCTIKYIHKYYLQKRGLLLRKPIHYLNGLEIGFFEYIDYDNNMEMNNFLEMRGVNKWHHTKIEMKCPSMKSGI
jgi:hypothetical protein